MHKKIVLATTPFEVCQCASDFALAMARKEKATLYIFYAFGVMEHGWAAVRHLVPSGEIEAVKKDMADFYKEKLHGIENVEIVVEPGLPHEQLIKLAYKVKADAIVMGPNTKYDHEKRKRIWGMTGSTLRTVTRKAKCPVYIVSQNYTEDQLKMDNIVMATDFTKASENALNFSCAMARHHDANLHVLHVVDLGPAGLSEEQYFDRGPDMLKEAQERMEREYTPKLAGDKYSFHAVEGIPHVEIIKFAREKKADLIVMSHRSMAQREGEDISSVVAQVALFPSAPVVSMNRQVESCT